MGKQYSDPICRKGMETGHGEQTRGHRREGDGGMNGK